MATRPTRPCRSGARPTASGSPKPRRLYYANDTYGGNSGSPVFAKRASGASQCAGWCVMSVHGYGLYGSYPNSSFNHGVRVNQEVSDAFFSWRAV